MNQFYGTIIFNLIGWGRGIKVSYLKKRKKVIHYLEEQFKYHHYFLVDRPNLFWVDEILDRHQ